MNEPLFSFVQSPETFFVEEELPYPLSGHGDFCFALFEKMDMSTIQLKRSVSEQAGIPMKYIKHAGLKDRLSTSRQYLCWEKKRQRTALRDGHHYRILNETLHDRALHTGQVAKNHFRLQLKLNRACDENEIRDLVPDRIPNFFGPQRFSGIDPENPAWPERKDRFLVSQFQASIFNLYLRKRFLAHGFDVFPEDLFTRSHGGRVFRVEDLNDFKDDDPGRPVAIPTGPLPGYKIKSSEHTLEKTFLIDLKLNLQDFRVFGKIALGTRRPLWVFPELEQVTCGNSTAALSFSLPGGSYATVFLSYMLNPEFMADSVNLWPRFDA
jgi:tRNA pseudouridine13 synthase